MDGNGNGWKMHLYGGLSPKRILTATGWFTLALGFGLWAILGGRFALSYTIGSLWMSLNFLALALLIGFLFRRKVRRKWLVILLVFAKMFILYFALVYMFYARWLDHLGLVVGLSTLWMVILFKAIGLFTFTKEKA